MIKIMLGGLAIVLLLASAAMWMLRSGSGRLIEGSVAPDFELQDQNGEIHRLSDYAGRWLVLYFYPRDNTPVCTREACHFRDNFGAMGDLDAALIGVSLDSNQSHAEFSRKHQLPFTLLSDPNGQTAAAYDSLLNLVVMRAAKRHTFIISPDGRIAARFDQVAPATHAQEVAQVLRALQQGAIVQAGASPSP